MSYLQFIKDNDKQGLQDKIKELRKEVDDFVKQAELRISQLNGSISTLESILDEMSEDKEE